MKNPFVALLNIRKILKNTSDYTDGSRLIYESMTYLPNRNSFIIKKLLLMVYLLRVTLLEMMTSLVSLKTWQYFITNKIFNVWSRRVLMVYFTTANWLLVYAISVILVC